MESFVHSLILKPNCLLNSLKSLSLIWTFIYSISKLSGVHIGKMIMKEMFVYMLITGKTIEESHLYSTIQKICAKIGIPKVSSHPIKMAANMNIDVHIVMVGRSKNSILTTSKLNNAYMVINVRSLIAHIITMKMTGNIRYLTGLDIFLKPELFHSPLIFMSQSLEM